MQGLSIEEVIPVADLANLTLTEAEKKNFACQLQDILSDIDKIVAIDIKEEQEILIAPTENYDIYHNDEVEGGLEMKDILKNANKTSGDYITVPKVLDE